MISRKCRPLLVWTCIVLASLGYSQAALAAAVGKLLFAVRSVELQRADGSVITGSKGTELFEGDIVTTGEKGRAQLAFIDGAKVALKPQTVFEIETYRAPSTAAPTAGLVAESGSGRAVLGMLQGGMRAISGNITKSSPDAMEVKTPVATMGIRGTVFKAALSDGVAGNTDSSPSLAVGVTSGKVRITNELGSVDVNPGEFGVVSQGSKPQVTVDQPDSLAGGDDSDGEEEQEESEDSENSGGEAAESEDEQSSDDESDGDEQGTESSDDTADGENASDASEESADSDTESAADGAAESGSDDVASADSSNREQGTEAGSGAGDAGATDSTGSGTASAGGNDSSGGNTTGSADSTGGTGSGATTSGASSGPAPTGATATNTAPPPPTTSAPAPENPPTAEGGTNLENPDQVQEDLGAVRQFVSSYAVTGPEAGYALSTGESAATATMIDSQGQALQFDSNAVDSGGVSAQRVSYQINSPNGITAQQFDKGASSATGFEWGRWANGTVQASPGPNGQNQTITLTNQQSLHWLYSPEVQGEPLSAITASASYRLVGNTSPTDANGNVGVLDQLFNSRAVLGIDRAANTGAAVGNEGQLFGGFG